MSEAIKTKHGNYIAINVTGQPVVGIRTIGYTSQVNSNTHCISLSRVVEKTYEHPDSEGCAVIKAIEIEPFGTFPIGKTSSAFAEIFNMAQENVNHIAELHR